MQEEARDFSICLDRRDIRAVCPSQLDIHHIEFAMLLEPPQQMQVPLSLGIHLIAFPVGIVLPFVVTSDGPMLRELWHTVEISPPAFLDGIALQTAPQSCEMRPLRTRSMVYTVRLSTWYS